MMGHVNLEVFCRCFLSSILCEKHQVSKCKTTNGTLIVEFHSKLRHLYIDEVSVETSMTVNGEVEFVSQIAYLLVHSVYSME